jgi:hypothetical protein
MKKWRPPGSGGITLGLLAGITLAVSSSPASAVATCARTLSADVVAIDMPIVNSRLGAANVNGMMYALRHDVVSISATNPDITATITDPLTGAQRRNAKLRDDKRPRPLVLRVAAGDCLDVNFQSLVSPVPNPLNAPVDRDGIGNDPNPVTADGLPQINVFTDEQTAERRVGFHAAGMQLRAQGGIANDGSYVGVNPSSLMSPGQTTTYHLFAEKEQVYQVINPAALVGSDANQGNTANGLFGQIIVEPKGARIYRNTVTEEEMRVATRHNNEATDWCPKLDPQQAGVKEIRQVIGKGKKRQVVTVEVPTYYCRTPAGHPVLDYEATFPDEAPWNLEGKAGLTVLNMIQGGKIVHTEIDAVIAGPNADGSFPKDTYPLETIGKRNPAYPNRLEAFRDFGQVWHDEVATAQAFPGFYNTGFRPPVGQDQDPLTDVFAYLLKGVRDKFMINYAVGGIGTEILSNRLGVGPMHDCLGCAYEEFFLTHFTVGEVGNLTDIPANAGLETITPQNVLNILLAIKAGDLSTLTAAEMEFVAALGPKATKVFYPGDPANINHSYIGDAIKFRNTHNGFEQHVFHLHNHQWLFNANDDNSNYIDAQGIGPGMGYTYEIANGGSGNRNKSSGDAIYHCHFYPHFAQGMWYMWRIHDTFEAGTKLAVSGDDFHTVPYALKDGTPAAGARALPDGEVIVGTPIPAVVPLPGKGLAPMPAGGVAVAAVDRNADGVPDASVATLPHAVIAGKDGEFGTADDVNPGYPFWVAGISCGLNDPTCDQAIVGQRPSTPPLDMVTRAEAKQLTDPLTGVAPYKYYSPEMKANFVNLAGDYEQMHGGLPRHSLHGVKAGGQAGPTIAGIVSPVDLTKFVAKAKPAFFPEGGTEVERSAMQFHSRGAIPSYKVILPDAASRTPYGLIQAASFQVNANPSVPGAVYSDPCMDDSFKPVASNGVNAWNSANPGAPLVSMPSGPFGAYAPRVYKGANIQYDAVLNKVGYHYPQQRIVSLWEDALPVIEKNKPGEPLVMRLNTFDCAMYHHTNLVPETYEMDDYQLRTPTDIIGQHIHLPKWDLSTTDGAGNGWNYEDGTLAAGAVRERIEAINCYNGHAESCKFGALPGAGHGELLHPAKHAFFPAEGPGGSNWMGARTTMQRWFADPLLNTQHVDRGLGIIFTHDHYGPSTFQQIGLYSTVLIEPARSTWVHNEAGVQLGCSNATNDVLPMPSADVNLTACRNDGGPTSWQAAILTGDLDADGKNDSFREFYFEYTDFQHAYEAGVYVGAGNRGQYNGQFDEKEYLAFSPALQDLFYPELHHGPADGLYAAGLNTFRFSIAPPLIKPVAQIFPDLTIEKAVNLGTGALSPARLAALGNAEAAEAGGFVPECIQRPCPTSIDFLEPGLFVANYRNEPVALRIYDPNKIGPDGKKGAQASGLKGDLAHALRSDIVRAIPDLNRMPAKGDVANPPAEVAELLPVTNVAVTAFPPHINMAGFEPGDPFTPMMRTYSGDRVRVKAQAGGDEEEHSVSVHGIKWLQGGSGHGRAPNSGWKNQSSGGISEQFTMASPVFMDFGQRGNTADYLYMMDAFQDGFWTGNWGIMRNYNKQQPDLVALPSNIRPVQVVNRANFQRGARNVCPKGAPLKSFDITAVSANLALPAVPGVTVTPTGGQVLRAGTPDAAPVDLTAALASLHAGGPLTGQGTLVFNPRTTPVTGFAQGITVNETGPLHEPTGMMYVMTDDLNPDGTLKAGVSVEPLSLRVNAGDCVQVTLRNQLPRIAPDLPNYNDMRHVNKRDRRDNEGTTVFGVNHVRPSSHVGFHTQLMEYDVTRSDGTNVGFNPVQTVRPGGRPKTYTYYAGDLTLAELQAIPTKKSNAALMARTKAAAAAGLDLSADVAGEETAALIAPAAVAADVTLDVAQSFDAEGLAAETDDTLIDDAVETAAANANANLDVVLATAVEFAGVNVLPADRVKQPQKGLFGQLVVQPRGASFVNLPGTRTQAEVTAPALPRVQVVGGAAIAQGAGKVVNDLPATEAQTYRDFNLIWNKLLNYRYASGNAVQNESEEGPGIPENPPHTVLGAANYGAEPTFFRYGIPPLSAAGGAHCAPAIIAPKPANPADRTCFGSVVNAGDLFSNVLTGGLDPATPVFQAKPGQDFRIELTSANSSNRGSTFQLHGHVWPRDPFLAAKRDAAGFPVNANIDNVGSVVIGNNPMQMAFGAQESIVGSAHYVIKPFNGAGGADAVTGDFLFRDTAAAGLGAGTFGILRVQP